LNRCRSQLAPIFDAITIAPQTTPRQVGDSAQTDSGVPNLFGPSPRQGSRRRFNELYDQARVRSAVRLAFSPKRELQTAEEVIPQTAYLLLAAKLDVTADKNLYPPQADVAG